jgi:ATP-binding cassette subfamily B protein RaxB
MIDLSWSGRGRLPVILQSETSECGLACLAMILGFHGSQATLGSLRSRLAISAHGLMLGKLLQLARHLGLLARALRLEKEDLPGLVLPAILHWELQHFVVLKSCSRKGVVLHDPARGVTEVSWQEFDRKFTGIAIELTPASGFRPQRTSRKLSISTFWQGSRGLWQGLSQILLLSVLLQAFALALPYYTQLFIDDVMVSSDRSLLKILAAGFLLVVLARSVTELLRAWVVMYLGNTLGFGFGTNLCRHLLALPTAWFGKRHLGDIVSRFSSLGKVRDFVTAGVVEVLVDGLMVIGTLTLMFLYSKLLTLVALVGVLLYVVLRLLMHHRWRLRNNEQIHALATENSLFMENIRAIQGIRLFGKEDERLDCWRQAYADVINTGVKVQWLGIHMKFASGLLMGSENILLLLLGGLAVLDNQLSIGMLMAYMSFKDQCYSRVFNLVDKLCEFRLLDLHLERLADIALEEATPQRSLDLVGGQESNTDICLQATGLGFRYPGEDTWLFRNLELTLAKGESVAIIGPTGCGKSTLLKILLGLLPACEGELRVNNQYHHVPGRKGNQQIITGVLQDDMLLSGSLLENITFFAARPDLERVEAVATMAAIADEIHRLPMRYHTLAGSMGTALSGGQVQRLLLARALYPEPALLILDEATSHLDLATESRVNAAIGKLGASRLIVAHRPDSILLADRILALTPQGLVPVSHAQFSASVARREIAA